MPSMKAGMPWDWTTFPEFLDSVARRPKAVNILPYVPVSPLLTWVMGLEAAKTRPPSEQETREICRLLDEAMDAGACGWSAQRLDPERSRLRAARLRRHPDGLRPDGRRDLPCARARARPAQRGVHPDDPGQRRSDARLESLRAARGDQRPAGAVQRCAAARFASVRPSRANPVARKMPPARASRLRAGGHQRHRHDVHVRRLEPVRRMPGVVRRDHRRHRTSANRSSRDPSRREALRSHVPRVITDEFDQIFVDCRSRATT